LLPRPTDFFFFTRNLFFLHQLLTGYLIHHIGSGDSRAPKAQSSHLRLRQPLCRWCCHGTRGSARCWAFLGVGTLGCSLTGIKKKQLAWWLTAIVSQARPRIGISSSAPWQPLYDGAPGPAAARRGVRRGLRFRNTRNFFAS
jgi:hypothetical protein